MNILIPFYRFTLFVICGNITFGKEKTLDYQNSKTETLLELGMSQMWQELLYTWKTHISYSEVRAVQNYELMLYLASESCLYEIKFCEMAVTR